MHVFLFDRRLRMCYMCTCIRSSKRPDHCISVSQPTRTCWNEEQEDRINMRRMMAILEETDSQTVYEALTTTSHGVACGGHVLSLDN
ncbi:hypothetical protein Y032_0080g1370 [Ancylostoma ceylanicum]|uniref:Uncharacterized protein n=1 Tax=Ancylostoma ceylanicum TaxID=53326 RepID=A0A016TT29_9BILA|nr:hypothetical protein Y032_0080g1370 [Ancylostoma ceylanicum]